MITHSLPVIDLHRHLDGNIRIQSIIELAQLFNINLPASNANSLRPFVQVMNNQPDLMAFLQKLDWGVTVLGDLDACWRVAYENVEDLKFAGIDYAELRFSPYYMAMQHHLPIQGVVEAVIDGVLTGSRDLSVKTNLIGIMSRTFGVDHCYQELEALLSQRDHLVAVDLAGDELGQPGSLFTSHFNKVRDAGLQVTIHAGEAAGPESIWQAINELGAARIGHGVKAVQDPKLMDFLAKHDIGIESCLTSNLQTSSITNIVDHPLKKFIEQGIKATINTDDPAVEGIELAHEYNIAAVAAGLSIEQIKQAQQNSLDIAFLANDEKQWLSDMAVNR